MEQTYRQSFDIADIHLDCFGRVKPSVLLYFVQEVSGKHAALLGASWEDLAEKELFWAILRHSVQIARLPVSGERITLETWPMPTTRVAYPRAVIAYDEGGHVIFRSTAIWVLMHMRTRAMVLPGKSDVVVPGILRGTELPAPPSIAPRLLSNQSSRIVGYTELDRNCHMNNTRYLDWLDDLLSHDFHNIHPLRQMTLGYLSEAREGQLLHLNWELDETLCLTAEAVRDKENTPSDTERVFCAKLQF